MGPGGLFAKLKERRFAQFLGVYSAAAWGALQVLDQLTNRGVLPPVLYDVALTLSICGFPAVLIVTWFHGQRGDQQMPRSEKALIGAVAVFALTASGFVVRAGLAGESGSRAIALEQWEDPTRVAVLYFDNLGGGEDADAIAAGLTTGLIDQLTAVDTLYVVSSNGSKLVRDESLSDVDAARKLGVGTLIRGAVTLAEDRVRVRISMIEGGEGESVSNKNFDVARANLFELQDSLSAQVALYLREHIGNQVERIEQSHGTEVVRAWELVQQAAQVADDAQQLLATGDLEGAYAEMSKADQMLLEAETLDPEWTLPITRRGWYEYRLARFSGANPTPQNEPTMAALAHAERALAINPKDSDALELRGTVKYWRMLIALVDQSQQQTVRDEAELDLLAAIENHPRPAAALASLSHLLLNVGDIAQAKLKAVSSYESDPFLANANVTLWRLASSSWDLGTAPEAEKWCREGQRRFPDDYRFQQCAVMLYALRDVPPDPTTAWEAMRKFVELAPPPLRELTEKTGLQYMAMALARAGEPDSAQAVALRGRAAPDVDPLAEAARLEAIARFFLARYYQDLGQQAAADEQWDQGIRQLGVFLAANPALMEGYQNEARSGRIDNWYLDGLVNQPRFRALVGVR